MATSATLAPSYQAMTMLSQLLLSPHTGTAGSLSAIGEITRKEFDELLRLASSNHVVIRGMERLRDGMIEAKDDARAEWAQSAIETEKERIDNALAFLEAICVAFQVEKHQVMVIKTLDHWPDFGSDIDLYTDAAPAEVLNLMRRTFNCRIAPRSWGDCLAGKWNFLIPGLPEAVEIHVGRLGQTGEQVAIASRLSARTRQVLIGECVFRVPSVSDRLMISTLQRMYRHYYFRLCDIVDTASPLESGEVDLMDLRYSATEAGIWEGVATYLAIASDYVKKYRGSGLDVPNWVLDAARFGGEQVYYAREFLRVPIMPQSAKLYGAQLAGLLKKCEMRNSARLSLLPWLAAAAVVTQRISGTDKGIW